MHTSTKSLQKESTTQRENASTVTNKTYKQTSERDRKSKESGLDLKSLSSKTSSSSAGKNKPTSGKLKTYPVRQKLSATHKPSVSKQRLSHSSRNSSSKTSLAQEDIEQFSSKFHELTEAIVKLVTSKTYLNPRSLEILLSKEIEEALGPAVNSPKFSQRFIQATRDLLEHLVCIYEEGKIANQLLTSQKTARPTLLRARSSATVCYRDKYLKELVMNMLHSMCSNLVEEEVSRASSHLHNLSESSRHRIHAIRDIVRAEAGIEPEAFHQLEKQLEELQRTLSKNKLEVLKAASEIEKTISEHLLRGLNSIHSLQIPESAREALKRGKVENRSDCGNDKTESSSNKNRLENNFEVSATPSLENTQTSTKTPKTFTHLAKDLQEEVVRDLDLRHIKYSMEATDLKTHCRPDRKKVICDELSKANENTKIILNCETKYNNPIYFRNLFMNSFEGSNFKTADRSYRIDELNSEETAIFLRALKADLQPRESKIVLEDLNRHIGLDMTGKYDDVMVSDKDMNLSNSKVKLSKGQNLNRVENENTDFQLGKLDLNYIVLEPNIYPTPITLINAPNTIYYCTVLVENDNKEILYETNEIQNTIPLKIKVSNWWAQDEFLAKEIVKELKQAFQSENSSNTFKVESESHNKKKCTEESKKDFQHLTPQVTLSPSFANAVDFTVGDISYILKEVSLEIVELPSVLQSTEPGEKEHLMNIISTVEHYLNGSRVDVTDSIREQTQFLLSVDNVSNTLLFLSERLQLLPNYLKKRPISVLNPPNALMNTLGFLASSDHFKNCFISAFDSSKMFKLQNNYSSTCCSSRQQNNIFSGNEIDQSNLSSSKQKSSETIEPSLKISIGDQYRVNVRKAFTRNPHKYDEFQTRLSKFEEHIGLGLSVITVQQISDIFLYFSTVLNNVPDRIKTQKLLDMRPPITLIKILEILYTDKSVIGDDERKNFASLTIQNASDFFLTLSKALQDAPPRIKSTPILELDPPPSLLNALTILTDLSQRLTSNHMKPKEVDENSVIESDSQESFFDALESLRDD